MKPAFIGLGAQKCASTWVHRILESHPDVVLPPEKEIDFFSYYFDRGYQWYERQLAGAANARNPRLCAGEISPSYFHHPDAPTRVSEYSPRVKLLVTLRDPVERALSNHRHEVRMGHFTGEDLSFEAGLANNPMYLEQGFYGAHLSRWLAVFPPEQIYVALMEDIRAEPERIAGEIFRFLGVDDSFCSEAVSARFNVSFANRSNLLARLKDGIYGLSRSPGLGWIWSAAAVSGIRGAYRRFNVVDSEAVIPLPRADTLAELRCRFAGDVRRLQELLDRDLTGWLGGADPTLRAAQHDAPTADRVASQ